MVTARLPLGDWDGAPGNSMIQGCHHDKPSNQFVLSQADDVAGQGEQDSVFRTHDHKMQYTGIRCTAKEGGHVSSFGIFHKGGQTHILLGHKMRGLVSFPLQNGRVTEYTSLRHRDLMAGTAACSEKHDLLCMRSGTVYEIYTLSSVLAGKPKRLARTVVTSEWYTRFQGHHITKIGGKVVLIIHGDRETKGHSEMRLLIVNGSKWRTLDRINTTGMGDEAEGCTDYNDRIWVCKRTGNGGRRIVDLTPTKHRTWLKAPAATKPKSMGKYRVVGGDKGYVWARRVGVQANRWEKRDNGFPVTTGARWVRWKAPDLGAEEWFLETKAKRRYRKAFLVRVP